MPGKSSLRLAALLLAAVLPVGTLAQGLAKEVVIVCNENEPESRPLADYYAQQRHLPTNRICSIRVRVAETITRREYREDIREPLLQFLTRHGLLVQTPRTTPAGLPTLVTVASHVSVVVLIHGVPLRIEADPALTEAAADQLPKEMRRNEAAVDSELALLPCLGVPATGALRNPFFASATAFGEPLNRQLLLVGRLDGPAPATVRRMIDDAVLAERIGLHGRVYFDTRASRDPGYAVGDTWLKDASELFRQAGYETELEQGPELFGQDFPMGEVAVYGGWYGPHLVGPFRREGFRFQRGAVAYHIHSSSAASLRARTAYWAGPLLDRGAAATMGNVFEPYLMLSPHVDRFYRRLLAGASFLEAAYASQPVVSWQTTFVGDPLYRPFAVSLDDQIARLTAEKRPELEWAYLRQINLLALRGRASEALVLCRQQQEQLNSPILLEKLGDLQPPAAAIASYQKLRETGSDGVRQLRGALKLARAYEKNQQPALGLAVYEELIGAYPQHSSLAEFCRRARDLAEAAQNPAKAAAMQTRLDQLLAAAKQKK